MADYNLNRFEETQQNTYATALKEIESGKKRTHWMWFIFPQLKGLGHSHAAEFYGLAGVDEAEAYLNHPVLGPRLIQITEALLTVKYKTASDIFGSPDDLKLCSCMTLFAAVPNAPAIFNNVLDRYYNGKPDKRTLNLIKLLKP